MLNQRKFSVKKCLITGSSLLLFVCLCLNVSAQDKIIKRNWSPIKIENRTVSFDDKDFEEMELEKLKELAAEKLRKSKYHLTRTTEKFDNEGSPYNFSTKFLIESVPPNSEHYIRESESVGKKSYYEKYSIGNKTYILQDDGSWKMSVSDGKVTPVSIGGGGGKGSGGPSNSTERTKPPTAYSLIKGQTVNGQKVDLYKITESFMRKTKDFEESSVKTDSYWFDKNGFIIKTEFLLMYKNKNKSLDTSLHIITNYEYDKNIKINPPNTKKKKNS